MDLINLINDYEIKNNRKLIILYNHQINNKIFAYLLDYLYKNKDIVENTHFDIILDTYGGYIESCIKIIKLLQQIKLSIYIPEKALSAGTVIALSCSNIHMNKFSRMGKIDPVTGRDSRENTRYLSKILKYSKNIIDENLLKSLISLKMDKRAVTELLNNQIKQLYDKQTFRNIELTLFNEKTPHYIPYYKNELLNMGINIKKIPDEINAIYDICKNKFQEEEHIITNLNPISKL